MSSDQNVTWKVQSIISFVVKTTKIPHILEPDILFYI